MKNLLTLGCLLFVVACTPLQHHIKRGGTPITALQTATALSGSELIPAVQAGSGSGCTGGFCGVAITPAQIKAYVGNSAGSGTVNAGTAGQIAGFGASGNAVSGFTVSGDCTFNGSFAISCTKSGGVAFGSLAFLNSPPAMVPSGGGGYTAVGTGCTTTALKGGPNASQQVAFGGFTTGGTTGTCSVVLTFTTTITPSNGWHCDMTDETAKVAFIQTAHTATSCTMAGTATSGDYVSYSGGAY